MAQRPSFTSPIWFNLSLLTAAISLLGCGSSDPFLNTPPQGKFTAQEQSVYAVILAQHFGSRSYVLMDRSQSMQFSEPEVAQALTQELTAVGQELEELKADTLANLVSANPRVETTPADLQLGAPVSLIDQSTLSALTASDSRGWKGFFERYPDAPGVLAIAHVGFDSTGKQALAFLYWIAGGLAAWRRFFLLEWSGDSWTIVDDVITMIS